MHTLDIQKCLKMLIKILATSESHWHKIFKPCMYTSTAISVNLLLLLLLLLLLSCGKHTQQQGKIRRNRKKQTKNKSKITSLRTI